jgi:hypothetical protein
MVHPFDIEGPLRALINQDNKEITGESIRLPCS